MKTIKPHCIYVAAAKGQCEVVEYLEAGMDNREVLLRDKNNRTPLHLAALYGHLEVVVFFIKDVKYDLIPLHYASDHIDIVKYLNEVTDSYFSNDKNNNSLHSAALNGHLEVVKFFIENTKCDPNCRDFSERTPCQCKWSP